jgi:hypothetical protein
LLAAIVAVGNLGAAAVVTINDDAGVLGFVGFLGFCVWVVATCVVMMVAAGSAAGERVAAATAPL